MTTATTNARGLTRRSTLAAMTAAAAKSTVRERVALRSETTELPMEEGVESGASAAFIPCKTATEASW